MRAPDEIEDTSDSRGFYAAIREHVAPHLLSKGFSKLETTPFLVQFVSSSVLVQVQHDHYSYEIGVTFARKANPFQQYDLRNVVDAELGPGHSVLGAFQASSADRVTQGIQTLAEIINKHAHRALDGDPAFYELMDSVAAKINALYTKGIMQRPIRNSAERAWQRRDFKEVLEFYGQILDDLTPVEKKRMEYARSHK